MNQVELQQMAEVRIKDAKAFSTPVAGNLPIM